MTSGRIASSTCQPQGQGRSSPQHKSVNRAFCRRRQSVQSVPANPLTARPPGRTHATSVYNRAGGGPMSLEYEYPAVTEELLHEVVRRILSIGSPEKIVLFGSRAR